MLHTARIPKFSVPTMRCRASFCSAIDEFHQEDRFLEVDTSLLIRPDVFQMYLDTLETAARTENAQQSGIVPSTTLWYVDGADFIGLLQIRHVLTGALTRVGGHVGYQVRPSARRQGYATHMLELALPIAHALGIDPLLVTCDESNIGSIKVIEANGGRPDAPEGSELRFWISTS